MNITPVTRRRQPPRPAPAPAATLSHSRAGFRDIAVVTNRSHLDDEEVREALLAQASTIRVSLYDWEEDVFSGAEKTFERLRALRRKIDEVKSPLRIGPAP